MVPLVFANVRTSLGKSHTKSVRVLLDSGASHTIIDKAVAGKLRLKKSKATSWETAAGTFSTDCKTMVEFQLPELSTTVQLKHTMYVHNGALSNYQMIIGRDLLNHLGIDICYSDLTVKWPRMNAVLPMKPREAKINTHFHVHDSVRVDDEIQRMSRILDSKYAPADLHEIVQNNDNLTNEEKVKFEQMLRKYESLFDGRLGEWQGDPYHIQLREDAKPYHAKAYPVPHAYEKTLRVEIDRLCKIGVLKKVNRSEWAFPSFIIPKKDSTVRFINDLRELNKRIRRMPYPLPKIQDLLLKLEGFQWATALDLNMGYYHIRLDAASRKLCTLVFPWGKYEMQALPMGLSNSPDIFQEKMSSLMNGLSFVRAYIDDLLVTTSGDFNKHLKHVETVLQRLRRVGLKVNARKSSFFQTKLDYLGYWITRDGIQPQPKKVEAILNIAPPRNQTELRSFIGLVNYYRDSWIRRSDILTPLSALTGKGAKWKWEKAQQDAFDTVKRVVAREVLLAYPRFDKPFEIFTDASDHQLGAVITQEGRPIAYYSRKLTAPQLNYTTTERELLAIVETLKEFRNILLGHSIIVYTDHKNLTYKVANTQRVMRWRLLIEEYGPELKYIKGVHNVVADALSRLDLLPPNKSISDSTVLDEPVTRPLHEAFAFTTAEKDRIVPIRYKLLRREQRADANLMKYAHTHPDVCRLRTYHGGDNLPRQLLTTRDGKILVPASLRERMVEWYHEILCHPGEDRTEETIAQHFAWKGMRNTVRRICRTCDACQRTKKNKKLYGILPPKAAEYKPWETLCVDTVGPYKIKHKESGKELELWAVTMIDPATGWFEIAEVPGTKRADIVANVVEQRWLTRYPWPTKVVMDRGPEFMAEFRAMLQEDYAVSVSTSTKRNPQSNAIVERVHQTIGNMLRTFRVHDNDGIDTEDPWSGILAAVAFAVRATVHTTSRATPMQLVFGRDAVLNIRHLADWRYIRERKQDSIDRSNARENAKRLPHQYKPGDQVLIKAEQKRKFGTDAYLGPYVVDRVFDNGTLRVDEGGLSDVYNIRNVTPYRV